MRIRSRALMRSALLGMVFGLIAAPVVVAAQEDPASDGSGLSVERVDARGESWRISGVSPGGAPTLELDGESLATKQQGITTDLVVVIDNDRSLPNGNLQLSSNAAATLLPGVGPIGKVGVVSTARLGAQQELPLSADPNAVAGAMQAVTADGDSAVWDAITRAAGLLESSDAPQKRVVAYVGSGDRLSTSSPGAAETALRLADAQLDVMTVPSAQNAARLSEMVEAVGGSFTPLAGDDDYEQGTEDELVRLDEQFSLAFSPLEGSEPVDLTVLAAEGEQTQVVSVQPGAVTTGAKSLSAVVPSSSLVQSILSNGLTRWLAVLLLAGAVVGFVWSLLNMVVPDKDSLENRLQVYEETAEGPIEGDGEAHGVMTVPILQRAVDFTGEMAEKRGFLESIEVSLERASLPLRAAEAMFFVATLAFLLGVVAVVLTGNLLMGLVVFGFALMLPKAILDMRVRRRQKKFVGQLPDMLALLAGTLKAGYSITQGFEAVSKEVDEPMGKELRRVVTEHRLGRTLEDALDSTAGRMGSDDFAWTVMAIKIQREVGGNLAELLMTVADTMTQRERLRRDVNSLTAEGRVSAFILGLLPPALGVVMYMMNRDYIMELFTPGLGYVMIGAAVVAMVIGFVWMKKIITIEV